MKEFFFILLISQLFIILIFFGPYLTPGSCKQLRSIQKRQALLALATASDSSQRSGTRIASGLMVLVLALDIWPIKGGLIHLTLFVTLIKLIR